MAGPNGIRIKRLQAAGLDPADFPAVEMASDLAPWEHPQHIAGNPMRLPPVGAQLRFPQNTLIGVPTGLEPPPLITPPSSPPVAVVNPWHVANIVSAIYQALVIAAINSQLPFLLQPPGKRNFLTLRNGNASGGANIYIDFGKPATVNAPIQLQPGQTILFDTVVGQNDVYAACDTAVSNLLYSYSNISDGT